MQNYLIVPRDMLQKAYDALEEIPDWSEAGSETWVLYHQLGTFLYPDPAFVIPPQKMASQAAALGMTTEEWERERSIAEQLNRAAP